VATVLCVLGGGNVAVAFAIGQRVQPERILSHASHQACATVVIGRVRCLATISTTSVSAPSKIIPATSGNGYGPTEFHAAYQLPCTPGGPVQAVCSTPSSYGSETVAIVDAVGYSSSSGTLESALGSYDSYYGLPTCTVANGCLNILNQTGATSPLPPNVSSGWSDEIALDVETVHMICQSCKIVLVEANDDMADNLAQAEVTAASLQPIAISNSWGSTADDPSLDGDFKYPGIAVVAAAGDDGTASNGQSWPADIPDVVSVAGTTLQLNTDKTWASETVWSGSGGGCSVAYTAPSWQTSLSDWATQGCSSGGRAFGDISADADPNTGAAIYIGSAWYIAGGTSLATPLIAAMYALAANLPTSTNAVTALYQNNSPAAFHDVTSGNDCTSSGQANCTAAVGFDTPSGLGAPYGLGAFQADPAPPTGLTAAYVSQTQLDLSWTAASASNGVANYQIYRNGTLLGSTAGTTYTDSGLTPNTTYAYYLTTTDTKGSVSAQTLALASGTFLPPDINQDGHINLLDFSLLSSKYGLSGSNLGRSDINHDGHVDLLDFSLLASKYGTE